MSSVLKNPFFIAIIATVLIGSACGLFFARRTTNVSEIFVVAGTFMLFAIVPTMAVAFVISSVFKYGAKLAAEQAAVPKAELNSRYMNQMLLSLTWAILGIVITLITYVVAQSSAGGTYVICTGAIVFGLLSFLYSLVGWLRTM